MSSPAANSPAGSGSARIDRAFAALAAVGTSLLATLQSGRIHPDEVYQFLEPANRLAFHFGYPAWEWEKGLRNWAVPGALAFGMKLVDLFGGTSALAHRFGAAAVVAAFGYAGFRGVLSYAERRTSSIFAARLAFALVLGWALSLYFLGRTMGESMGALCAVAGIAALDDEERPFRSGLIAGSWLGLSVVVRYGFASLVIAVLIQAAVCRRWRAIAGAVASGVAVALLLGALDWATWGAPWHSLFAYMGFNLGSGTARQFGSEPWWFYAPVLAAWLPWPMLGGLPWFRLKSDRMLAPALAFLFALSATAHKEQRLLFPTIFLVAVALAPSAAEGLTVLWRRGTSLRIASIVAAVVFAAFSAWTYSRLPDLEGDLFRATMRAGADPKLNQLIVVNESRWGCGGNFYVGRDVPVYYTGPGYPGYPQAMANPAVNRAIIFRSPKDQADLERHGFHQVDAVGQTTILER